MLCAIIFAIFFINSVKTYGVSRKYGPDLSYLNGLGDQIRQQVQDSLKASGIPVRFHPDVPNSHFIDDEDNPFSSGFLNQMQENEDNPFSSGFLSQMQQKMDKMNADLAAMGAFMDMGNGISGVTVAKFNGQQILIIEGTQYECQGTIIKPTSAGDIPECEGNTKPVINPCVPIGNRVIINGDTCIGQNINAYTINGRTTCVGGTLYSNDEIQKMCGDSSNLMFEYYPLSGQSISPLVTCLNPGQFYCTFKWTQIPYINDD